MADEENVVAPEEIGQVEDNQGPIPGSSPIVIEDAPVFVAPVEEAQEEPQPIVVPAEAPKPAPKPEGFSAKTLAEMEAGRKKVEERFTRDILTSSARAADEVVPGGQEARAAQAREANSEL